VYVTAVVVSESSSSARFMLLLTISIHMTAVHTKPLLLVVLGCGGTTSIHLISTIHADLSLSFAYTRLSTATNINALCTTVQQNTTGTQWWIYDLGYKIAALWKPWSVSKQIAGFVTQFEGFTFVTVHSAGYV
jgi:Serine carboxypeptidase